MAGNLHHVTIDDIDCWNIRITFTPGLMFTPENTEGTNCINSSSVKGRSGGWNYTDQNGKLIA